MARRLRRSSGAAGTAARSCKTRVTVSGFCGVGPSRARAMNAAPSRVYVSDGQRGGVGVRFDIGSDMTGFEERLGAPALVAVGLRACLGRPGATPSFCGDEEYWPGRSVGSAPRRALESAARMKTSKGDDRERSGKACLEHCTAWNDRMAGSAACRASRSPRPRDDRRARFGRNI